MTTQLDTDQLKAVETRELVNLIIAGAGSGKTRTIIERINWLLEEGVAIPSEIVVITFTNAAADEISTRLARSPNALQSEQSGSRLLLGYCGTLHGFMLKLCREHGDIVGLPSVIAVADDEQREQLIEDAMTSLKWNGTRKEVDEAIAEGPPMGPAENRLDKVEIVARHYYRMMQSAGLLDFDSILFYGLAILAHVRKMQYRYLFVDEFQDSGDLDFKIYRALPIEQKFYVGDPDQAIYSFRGGDVRHILALSKMTGVRGHVLQNNYRCGPSICEAANELISHNPGRIEKRTISRTPYDSSVELLSPCQNPVVEASKLASIIATTGIQDDCAVLCRSNWLVTQFAIQFQAAGLRVAQREFARQPEDWKKTRRLIALLANPYSDLLAMQFLAEFRGQDHADSVARSAALAGRSINEYHLQIPALNLANVPQFLFQYGISEQSHAKVGEAIGLLPTDSKVGDLNLALNRDLSRRTEVGKGVVVTTIHAAKGREWGTVFLPAFEQETIPGDRKSANIEEERRLAFVGFTRAKVRLVISFCTERTTEFERRPFPVQPSQFIVEAGLRFPVNNG